MYRFPLSSLSCVLVLVPLSSCVLVLVLHNHKHGAVAARAAGVLLQTPSVRENGSNFFAEIATDDPARTNTHLVTARYAPI